MAFSKRKLFKEIHNEVSYKSEKYIRVALDKIDIAMQNAEVTDAFLNEYFKLKKYLEAISPNLPAIFIGIITSILVSLALQVNTIIFALLITAAVGISLWILYNHVTKQAAVLEPYLLKRMEEKINSRNSNLIEMMQNSHSQEDSANDLSPSRSMDANKEDDALREDVRKEYDVARENCRLYFERMYKILEFSIGIIVAAIGIDAGLLGGIKVTNSAGSFIFLYVLPICLCILGLLYAYNAYSLSVDGNEAAALRKRLYENKEYGTNALNSVMRNYIKTGAGHTIIGYGSCLLFYMFVPFFCIQFGRYRDLIVTQIEGGANFCCMEVIIAWLKEAPLAMVMWIVYFVCMVILIVGIIKNFARRDL